MNKTAIQFTTAFLVLAPLFSHAYEIVPSPAHQTGTNNCCLRHIDIRGETGVTVYSAYSEAVYSKMERIGNLLLPDSIRSAGRPFKVAVDIAIKADGSLDSVGIAKSSGNAAVNEFAVKTVNQVAPFAPFPDALAKEADIIHMRRTMTYYPSNKLGRPAPKSRGAILGGLLE